ncbi:MAG: DMT family transporter [Ktedonobacterales bacterium]
MRIHSRTQVAPASTDRNVAAFAGVWFAVIAWGGSYVAARLLLHVSSGHRTALTPTALATARFGLASLCFLPPLVRAMVRREVSRRALLHMAVLGQIAFSLYFWLQYTGVQRTSAGISSILVIGLTPIATLVVSQRLGQERMSLAKVAALLFGSLGVTLIVMRDGIFVAPDASYLFGALCLVANAFAFAVYATLSKRWLRGVSPLVVTAGTIVSGTAGLLTLVLLDPVHSHLGDVQRLDAPQWGALLYLALVCSVGAYFAYNFALTRLPASRAALYLYFEPVVAVLLGVSLLGETLTWQIVAGAGVIAASVGLANLAHAYHVGRHDRVMEPSASTTS